MDSDQENAHFSVASKEDLSVSSFLNGASSQEIQAQKIIQKINSIGGVRKLFYIFK